MSTNKTIFPESHTHKGVENNIVKEATDGKGEPSYPRTTLRMMFECIKKITPTYIQLETGNDASLALLHKVKADGTYFEENAILLDIKNGTIKELVKLLYWLEAPYKPEQIRELGELMEQWETAVSVKA